jgi:leucyl-tRNA synthetase
MELVNDLYAYGDAQKLRPGRRGEDDTVTVERPQTAAVLREAIEALVLLMSPVTPHLCEELWERLGHREGVVAAGWPSYDPQVAKAEELVIPVQVNGKVRARLTVPADVDDEELKELALAHPQVQAHTTGRRVERVVIVKGKLVGVVAR